MSKTKLSYILLFAAGIGAPFIDEKLGVVYVCVGLLCLSGVQLAILPKSGKWAIIGGNPAAKIDGRLKTVSLIGLSMVVGVTFGFLIKLASLGYSL